MEVKEKRISKWYHGGVAAAGATCVTHPLDLIKVQLQTQKGKAFLIKGKQLPFHKSVFIAGLGGLVGGLAGNPADLVNVRMQNDMKLPRDKRRNYKNAFDGLHQIISKEGVGRLWTGAVMNCPRSALMTIGQLSLYDQAKALLLSTSFFEDNVVTHISSSVIGGIGATTMTQPVDVLKTRLMNAKPGEVTSVMGLVGGILKEGPMAFFKGYIPAFARLVPHNVFTFIFLEQLRLNFGTIQKEVVH